MEELKAKCDQLLGRSDLKGALEVLGQAAPAMSNEIILTQARLSGLQQNIRLGIISHSDAGDADSNGSLPDHALQAGYGAGLCLG